MLALQILIDGFAISALYGLAAVVQGILHLLDDKVRHLSVDVAGQLDKARLDARLLGLP